MPHVRQFVHTLVQMRKGNKKKKIVRRDRSDLAIEEFGEKTRYKDESLSGQDLSPHWNEKGEVEIFCDQFHYLRLIGRNTNPRRL